ncbi:oxygenase MpaB family protein [Cecembia rubra]|uniref:oxygenase MpaB family protein n=1 Tax=Cecembia rubra TaxID=1485585 RepID=UPI0027153F16|nr:oxygenase MpaB family protein [Cecembia rubra]
MNKVKLYLNTELDTLRNQGDPLGDRTVQYLFSNPGWIEKINSWSEIPSPVEIDQLPTGISDYLRTFQVLPEWRDVKKIKTAQDFFDKEGNIYLSMLGFYSLPYCYAFADGAQVLVRSRRITEEIGMRLTETALFLLDSFRPGTFLENDKAMLTLSKVRLIHAFSRFFIQKYSKDWNPDWGLPINQEDMLGTNLAFSLLVLRGMEKLGKFPGKEVSESVLHYWKVLGFFLGIDISYWPETGKESFELEKAIRKRHLKSSESGHILIQALLKYYRDTINDPALAARAASLVAYFVGKDVAEVLGIKTSIALPKEVYGVLLDLSFFKQYGSGSTYERTRRSFLDQCKMQFGRLPELKIPSLNRS